MGSTETQNVTFFKYSTGMKFISYRKGKINN